MHMMRASYRHYANRQFNIRTRKEGICHSVAFSYAALGRNSTKIRVRLTASNP